MTHIKIKSLISYNKKNGWYSLISLLSLVLGLTTVIFVGIYIHNQLTYDSQHENKDRIYRLGLNVITEDGTDKFPFSSMPLGPTMKEEIPAIESYVRFSSVGQQVFVKQEESNSYFKVDNFYMVDSTIFDIFTHYFILGNANSALNEPNSIVITKELSDKLTVKLGDFITVKGQNNKDVVCKLTGIIENPQPNSFMKIEGLISMGTISQIWGHQYYDYIKTNHKRPACFTYFLMKRNVDLQNIKSYFNPYLENYMNKNSRGMKFDINFHSLRSLRFSTGILEDFPKANNNSIIILAIVGFLVLIVSCINYINLEISLSMKRFKEIAIKKMHGSEKKHISIDYLIGSIIFTFVCILISLVVILIIAKGYTSLTGIDITWKSIVTFKSVLFVILLTLIVGLASGSYTSFYLARVNALDVIRNNRISNSKSIFRKLLIIFQIVISLGSIFAQIVISNQNRYLSDKDLGFKSKNVLNVAILDNPLQDKGSIIINSLKLKEYIDNVSSSSSTMDMADRSQREIYIKEDNELNSYLVNSNYVDDSFIDLHQIKVVEGRNFSNDYTTDLNSSCIINEYLAKKIGKGKSAINTRIYRDRDGKQPLKIIGVVQNFHYEKLNTKLGPYVFFMGENMGYLNIKYREGMNQTVVSDVKNEFEDLGAQLPIQVTYLQESIRNKYEEEIRFNKVFRILSILAILISIIGIIGYSTLNIKYQLKDIAIKKILGASFIRLFTNDIFRNVKLLSFASIIAIPASYIFLENWLANFTYRIDISFWHITGSILLILGIIIITTFLSIIGILYIKPSLLIKDE